MRKYLIPENGNFYKANLHCHTTFSDGKKTPAEVKELYRSLGYSVVAYTDHDILIAHDELNDENFLALHGFEMEINEPGSPIKRTCHLCFIGIDPENMKEYLEFFRFGAPTHGGFGLGITRTLVKLFDLPSVKDVTFLFRGPNRLTP